MYQNPIGMTERPRDDIRNTINKKEGKKFSCDSRTPTTKEQKGLVVL